MLLCNAPTYKRVVHDYKFPAAAQKRDKQRENHSKSPPRTRNEDLEAFLSGQGAVYGSPNWQEEWEGERFLPELTTTHASQVLLPFVKQSEKKRQKDAKEAKRRAAHSPQRDESIEEPHPGRSRPMSASAEGRLQQERAKLERPRSAKNQEVVDVKVRHQMLQAQQQASSASRPPSAELRAPASNRRSSLQPGAGPDLPPDTRSGNSRRPSSSQSFSGKPPTSGSARREASRQGSQGGGGGRASVSGGHSRHSRRGRGSRGKGVEEGPVDAGVVRAMKEELDAVRALEESGRAKMREREEELHDLRQERLSLTQTLSEAQDRYLQIYEEVERAREANARFEDVKRMLQLSEEERVRLIERVEDLTEETTSWRPLKHKLEGRVHQLEEESDKQHAEIERLKGLEEQLRSEKERNVANQIQIQSWQDICSELQTKCDRWEQVKDSLELTLKATQADTAKLRSERDKLDKAKKTYYDMLIDLNIDVAEEEEHSDEEEEEEEEELDMDAEADPLTTLRTMSLLKGQLPEVGVPQEDTEAVGVDELAEVPPYGSVDEAAPSRQILTIQ